MRIITKILSVVDLALSHPSKHFIKIRRQHFQLLTKLAKGKRNVLGWGNKMRLFFAR